MEIVAFLLMAVVGVISQVPAEYNPANTTDQCNRVYLNRITQKPPATCVEQFNLARCLARANGYLGKPITSVELQAFGCLVLSIALVPIACCHLNIFIVLNDLALDILQQINAILITTKGEQPVVGTPQECVNYYVGIIIRGTLGCSTFHDYIVCYLLALGVDINTYALDELLTWQSRLNLVVSLYLKDCFIDLRVIINGFRTTSTSTTATPLTTTRIPTTPTTGPGCLMNMSTACENQSNGDYALCFPQCLHGTYIACSNHITEERPCGRALYGFGDSIKEENMVFDPMLGRCERSTTACPRDKDMQISSYK